MCLFVTKTSEQLPCGRRVLKLRSKEAPTDKPTQRDYHGHVDDNQN
jgi:hypothetical protein